MLPARKFSGPIKGSFSLVKGTQVLRNENRGTDMKYTHAGFSASQHKIHEHYGGTGEQRLWSKGNMKVEGATLVGGGEQVSRLHVVKSSHELWHAQGHALPVATSLRNCSAPIIQGFYSLVWNSAVLFVRRLVVSHPWWQQRWSLLQPEVLVTSPANPGGDKM